MASPPRIGFVVASARSLTLTQSTTHLIRAALSAGYAAEIAEPDDFEVDERGRVSARVVRLDPGAQTTEALALSLRHGLLPRRHVRIAGQRALLLRASPLNASILAFAQLAAASGVPVRNAPEHLVRTSHKAWLATLAGVPKPATLVTRSVSAVRRFLSAHGAVVLKPARASGGRGVARVSSGQDVQDAMDAASLLGDHYVVAQAYVLGAEQGERRLIYLAGRGFIGGYLRVPAPGEFRHNLRLGAEPLPCPPDARDANIAESLAPHLQLAGVWLAGVDVIDGRVIEVNTLNPGGLHWASVHGGRDLAAEVIAALP